MTARILSISDYLDDLRAKQHYRETRRKIAELQARLVAKRQRIAADLDRMDDNSWRAPSDIEVPFAGVGTMFHVGQRVTLKNPLPEAPYYGEAAPMFGAVYTIRAIDDYSCGVGLRFEEIHNKPNPYSVGTVEVAFRVEYFRPVVERKADIAIFQAMLTPKPKKARERA